MPRLRRKGEATQRPPRYLSDGRPDLRGRSSKGKPSGKTLSEREIKRRLHLYDLILLDKIISGIRSRLKQKERSRISSLAAYHKNGAYERRLKRIGPKLLEGVYRRVLQKQSARQKANLSDLWQAARVVPKKMHQKVNSKLAKALRRYFEKAFHTGSKSERVRELLGCTVEEVRVHLEKQFKPGMSWENHSFEGWHIDHIRPIASFDLTDPAQQKLAFHYTNLQPLWGKENLEKSDQWPLFSTPGATAENAGPAALPTGGAPSRYSEKPNAKADAIH